MNPSSIEHGKAIAGFVLGICSCVSWFFGIGAILGVILGIIGIIMSRKATAAGNTEGINKAGFILSIIGLCVSGIVLIVTLFLVGGLAASGALM